MYELVAELGLETFPTYNEGEHVIRLGGKTTRLGSQRGAIPKINPIVLADLFQGLARFEKLAQRIPLDEPWTAPGAARLDGQTFETWIRRNLRTATGREYFRIATEAVFSAQSTDLSALHAAFYTHSGTDFETLLSVDRGAQQDRIVGGSWRISETMAAELGDRVRTSAPVRTIEHGDDGVRVTTRGGERFEADRVIVTLPPTLAGRLEYAPALPSWRDQLTQRLPAGSVIKLYCRLRRAVLAGRRPHRPGRVGGRAGQDHVRQLAAGRAARDPHGLHGGQRRSRSGGVARPTSGGGRPSTASSATSGRRRATRSSTSSATGWPRSSAAAATAPTSRPASGRPTATPCATPDRSDPLGRRRVLPRLERLHGGRRAIRRVHRRRRPRRRRLTAPHLDEVGRPPARTVPIATAPQPVRR